MYIWRQRRRREMEALFWSKALIYNALISIGLSGCESLGRKVTDRRRGLNAEVKAQLVPMHSQLK